MGDTTTDTSVEGADLKSDPAAEADQQPDTANAEAAKYRRQLRDAETERDALREQVAGFRRAEVERMATELADPADLWRETELDDLLGEDGSIDPELVAAAVAGILEKSPHWQKPKQLPPAAAPASTVTSDEKIGMTAATPTWSDVIRKPR